MTRLLILTPIWKEKLDINEYNNIKFSLAKNNEFEHAFFYGKTLNLSFYKSHFPNSNYFSFESIDFDTIEKYNCLLQSNFFYNTFDEYEFILILQTDALLIKNIAPLLILNYDYIGATWFTGFKIPSILFHFKLFSMLLKSFGFHKTCHVGNGGLSLRRVRVFSFITNKYRVIKWLNEDFKFSLFIEKKHIKAPSFADSKLFFFEKSNLEIRELPEVYGYHAIQKYYPGLYKSLIERLKKS